MTPIFAKTVLFSYFAVFLLLTSIAVNGKDYITWTVVDGYNYTFRVTCGDGPVMIQDYPKGCNGGVLTNEGSVRSKEANDAIAAVTDEGIAIGATYLPDETNSHHIAWSFESDDAHPNPHYFERFAYTNFFSNGSLESIKCLKNYCNFKVDDLKTEVCGTVKDPYTMLIIAPKSYDPDRRWVRAVSLDSGTCPESVQAKCYACQDVEVTSAPTPAPPTKTAKPTTTTTPVPTTAVPTTTKPVPTSPTPAPAPTTPASTTTKLTHVTTQAPTTNTTQAPTTTLKPTSVPGPTKVPTSPPGPVSLSPAPIVGPCYNNLPSLILTAVMIFAMIY